MNGDDLDAKRQWHSTPVQWGTFVASLGMLISVLSGLILDRIGLEKRITQLDERQQFNLAAVSKMLAENAVQEKELSELKASIDIHRQLTERKMGSQ